mgnify:CR=1 FL=1
MSIRPLRAVDVVLDDAPVTCLHEFTARRDYLLDVDGRRHGQPLPGTGGCGFRSSGAPIASCRGHTGRETTSARVSVRTNVRVCSPEWGQVHLLRHHSHLCLALGPPAVNGPKAAGNQKGSATDLGTGYRAAQRAWESASGRQLYLKKRTACVR